MEPTQSYRDRFKQGESYTLPLNHALLQESYPSRGLELQAIMRWGEKNGVQLRSEASLEIEKEGDRITSARILTYDYLPEAQAAKPHPYKSKPVLELQEETEMGW